MSYNQQQKETAMETITGCTCPMDEWYQQLCDYCIAEDALEVRDTETIMEPTTEGDSNGNINQ